MPVPEFQKYFQPFLQLINDDNEHKLIDIIDKLAIHFNLSDEDKEETTPGGGDTRHANRVKWTRTYLKKAGLIESPGRGKVKITSKGKIVLSENPATIDIKYLERFPEFKEFRTGTRQTDSNNIEVSNIEEQQTPEEILEASYNSLREKLAKEILEKIKTCSPQFFEKLVIDLLIAMGYGGSRKDAGKAVGQSRDGGIDGIIKEDKLGLDVIYIQAKKWENIVGRPTVQAFAGSLMGKRANKGVFITTSKFSPDAIEYVNQIEKKIILIDGDDLAQFMIDHNVGVYEAAIYSVKKINLDYFEGE